MKKGYCTGTAIQGDAIIAYTLQQFSDNKATTNNKHGNPAFVFLSSLVHLNEKIEFGTLFLVE